MSPTQIKLIGSMAAILLSLGGAFLAGIEWEGNRRDAQSLAAERKAARELKRTTDEWSRVVQGLTQQGAAERQKSMQQSRDFERRLANVKAPLIQCPEVVPSGPSSDHPVGMLSVSFVRLYNDALGIGLPDAFGPWGSDGVGASADPH